MINRLLFAKKNSQNRLDILHSIQETKSKTNMWVDPF